MVESEQEQDIKIDVDEANALDEELAFLFGKDIVEQARLIDIADLNLVDEMTAGIRTGIQRLKQLKHDPEAQQQWVTEQNPALQLLLCLWIMDLDLLEKIQTRSYL